MSDPIASFSGIVSGINFRDLVDQIIQVESRPASLLQNQISEITRKTTAWGDFDSRVETLNSRAEDLSDGTAFNSFKTAVSGFSATEGSPITVSASTDADAGSFSVQVLQLAQREKLGGNVVDSRTEALGFSGEFVVNGSVISVASTDALNDLASKVNLANTGSSASGVSAAVVSHPNGGYRLVMTAAATGSEGIQLRDGADGVLVSLGLADGTTDIKTATSDGAKSDGLASSSATVASQLDLGSPPASSAVTIGGFSVTIDLANEGLDDIASAINTAAGLASSSVTAQVISEEVDGETVKRLDISGTTAFTDANGILETLGILEGGRTAIAQTVEGTAFTDGDGVTPATGSTLLVDLWNGTSEGVADGDTLKLKGTRGDGTTFTKTFAITGTTTYQDLVDALNSSSDGFDVGSRTATASIDATGKLVVTDDTSGDSRLALSIVANNEGGGTLDFGDMTTATLGRDIQIAEGRDAQVEIDGTFITRSKNVISDVVEGVTITLNDTSDSAVNVEVDRNVDATVAAIDKFVKAFNAVSEYVQSQFDGAGAEGDRLRRPLSGDSLVRQMRTTLREAMETRMTLGVTGELVRLADVGIEIDSKGLYEIDTEALKDALASDPKAVERLFSNHGIGSTSSLEYLGAGDDTTAGTYDVVITQAAAQGTQTGSGFGGTYVDDGTDDTITITDAGTNSVYNVNLSNGMTLADVVDALNTEFQTAEARTLEAADGVYSDAIGTAATDSTLLQDLYDVGGTNMGIADDDVFTISGSRDDGTSYLQTFTVTDITTQTLGDLRAVIAEQIGGDVVVDFQNGKLTATAREEGRSLFSLAVTSNNTGGGTMSFGSIDPTVIGRNVARLTASDDGGELKIAHTDYGAAEGFDVAYTAGGTDGSASLGLAAGSYRGVDVTGTIGGLAATGAGRILTGGDDTAVAGMLIRYGGTSTGAIGSMTFSRGIASVVQLAADAISDNTTGSIKSIIDGMDTRTTGLNNRIDEIQARLDRRRENLIRQFSSLEAALARAQSQSSWIQAQLGALPQ